MKLLQKVTEWKEYTEHSTRCRMRVTYGFDVAFAQRYKQAPCFSITADIERKRRTKWLEDSFGCLHDEIRAHFPELASLIKWHLVAYPFKPMHYQANALYWLEIHLGCSKYGSTQSNVDPLEAFKSQIVFGILPDDKERFEQVLVDFVASRDLKTPLYAWLESRIPQAQVVFEREMKELD